MRLVAAVLAVFLSIPVVARGAEGQIRVTGIVCFGVPSITVGRMSYDIVGQVCYTSFNDEASIAVFYLGCCDQIMPNNRMRCVGSRANGCWVYNLSTRSVFHSKARISRGCELVVHLTAIKDARKNRKRLVFQNARKKLSTRFVTEVLDLNTDFNVAIKVYGLFKLSHGATDPSTPVISHLVQLPLHGSGLFAYQTHLLSSGNVIRSAFSPHFAKLLTRISMEKPSEQSDRNGSNSGNGSVMVVQPTNDSHYGIPNKFKPKIFGLFKIALGYFLVFWGIGLIAEFGGWAIPIGVCVFCFGCLFLFFGFQVVTL